MFTLWGNFACPSKTSHLIYRGVMSGAHYKNTGGGSNFLCLPRDNSYEGGDLQYSDKIRPHNFLYPATYANPRSGPPHYHQIACAVCHAKRMTSSVMIPGKSECPMGWTRQYHGYLMSEDATGHKNRYQFVCIDHEREVARTGKNWGGVSPQKYGTNKHLPSGYNPNRELNCVVCTM